MMTYYQTTAQWSANDLTIPPGLLAINTTLPGVKLGIGLPFSQTPWSVLGVEPVSKEYLDAWAGDLVALFVELINHNPIAAGAFLAAMQQHRLSGETVL